MDVAFKLESNSPKISIDIADRMKQPSTRLSSCSSSRSTEFQTVLDGFSDLKINEAKAHENETTKGFDEKLDSRRLLNRRQSSVELTPGDVVMEFSQAPPRIRRKSLPSLGLVAVDIQYSVPTKMKNSKSFPCDMTARITGNELKSIQEIPKKGTHKPNHFQGMAKKPNKPESNIMRRRRFPLGAQRNITLSSSAFVSRTNQRRASCTKIAESPSEWRVEVHKRNLDINDEDDRLYPHIQTRRASYAGVSSISDHLQNRQGLLPRIGKRNALVREEDKQ